MQEFKEEYELIHLNFEFNFPWAILAGGDFESGLSSKALATEDGGPLYSKHLRVTRSARDPWGDEVADPAGSSGGSDSQPSAAQAAEFFNPTGTASRKPQFSDSVLSINEKWCPIFLDVRTYFKEKYSTS